MRVFVCKRNRKECWGLKFKINKYKEQAATPTHQLRHIHKYPYTYNTKFYYYMQYTDLTTKLTKKLGKVFSWYAKHVSTKLSKVKRYFIKATGMHFYAWQVHMHNECISVYVCGCAWVSVRLCVSARTQSCLYNVYRYIYI